MTISLSLNSIITQIHASVALARVLEGPEAEIITPDSDEALRELARSAMTRILVRLFPVLTGGDLGEDSDPRSDIISLDLRNEMACYGITIRLLAERAIVASLLSTIFSSLPDLADIQIQEAEKALFSIDDMLARATPAYIEPYP